MCFVPAVPAVSVRSSLCLQSDVCFVPAVPVVSVRSSLCLQSDISCVCFVFCACTTNILWRVAVRSSLRLQPDVCVVCFVPAVPVSCGELQ